MAEHARTQGDLFVEPYNEGLSPSWTVPDFTEVRQSVDCIPHQYFEV